MEVVASLSQGRTAAAQCGLFTYKSVPVIFEPPCTIYTYVTRLASNEIFPPSNKIHREVGRVKDFISTPGYRLLNIVPLRTYVATCRNAKVCSACVILQGSWGWRPIQTGAVARVMSVAVNDRC